MTMASYYKVENGHIQNSDKILVPLPYCRSLSNNSKLLQGGNITPNQPKPTLRFVESLEKTSTLDTTTRKIMKVYISHTFLWIWIVRLFPRFDKNHLRNFPNVLFLPLSCMVKASKFNSRSESQC